MPDLHTEFSRLLPADEIAELSPTLLKDQRNRFTSAPDIILQPRSVESVQTIMRFCYEHRIPVTPQGGNTGLCGAAVSENGVLLNLSKLNRIRSINLSDNCITVEAGSVLQTVQQAAEASNRLFP
ncbi:oxidoreductase, partial [Neisseria meningitidis]